MDVNHPDIIASTKEQPKKNIPIFMRMCNLYHLLHHGFPPIESKVTPNPTHEDVCTKNKSCYQCKFVIIGHVMSPNIFSKISARIIMIDVNKYANPYEVEKNDAVVVPPHPFSQDGEKLSFKNAPVHMSAIVTIKKR